MSSMKGVIAEITSTFNPTDESQRKFTSGRGRQYVGSSVISVIRSPLINEKLRNRDMVGYFGHGLRSKLKKMVLDATEFVDGKPVKVIPACVTASISVDDDCNVTHIQQILDNNEGRESLAMHNGKVGGFSWAAKWDERTGRVYDLYGFDYVTNPLFPKNRGFALDSMDGTPDLAGILDSMVNHGVEEEYARMRMDQWLSESALDSAINKYTSAMLDIADMNCELETVRTQLDGYEKLTDNRRSMILDAMETSKIILPSDIIDSIVKLETQNDAISFFSALDSYVQQSASLPINLDKSDLKRQSSTNLKDQTLNEIAANIPRF